MNHARAWRRRVQGARLVSAPCNGIEVGGAISLRLATNYSRCARHFWLPA